MDSHCSGDSTRFQRMCEGGRGQSSPGPWGVGRERHGPRLAGDTGAWSWEIAPEGRGGACSDGETAIGFCTRSALENLAGSFLGLQVV